MTTRAKLLYELDLETEHYSPHTRSQYFSHVTNYLDFVGNRDWRDRDVLYNYLKKLKKAEKNQDHINYIVRGPIGALFRAHGLRIPVKLPRVRVTGSFTDITSRIQFSFDEMVGLINGARAAPSIQVKGIMAVATIYGPRAGEILDIRKDDIHPKKNTIVIRTEKYGFKREHLVPDQIKPYIFGYDFHPISDNDLYNILVQAHQLGGVEKKTRKAFHAIRHGLITAMRYEVDIEVDTIQKFMAWKEGGMVGYYARPFPYLPKVDHEVFAKHPFLEHWA